jgi:DNA-binding NarL/FixJ family response regulator
VEAIDNGDEASSMNKIILADSQAIFRAGTAKVLAIDEDFRIIAQCSDTERMMHAITTFPGAIVDLCCFAQA